jgi:hypothetical protein
VLVGSPVLNTIDEIPNGPTGSVGLFVADFGRTAQCMLKPSVKGVLWCLKEGCFSIVDAIVVEIESLK